MAIENSAGDFGYGPSDAFINAQSEQGQKSYERQRYGRPRFQFPDISQDQVDRNRLLNVLMGASGGVQAASGAANPLAAIALGLGGGIQSGQQMQAQQQAAQLARTTQEQAAMLNEGKIAEDMLNQAPVGQVSPKIAEALKMKYGMDVGDIPMGQFQKFSSLLQHTNDLEQKLFLLQQKAGLSESKNNYTLDEAKLLEKSYKIPADVVVGKDKMIVNQQLIGFRPFQRQAQTLLQAQVTINNLKSDWEKIKDKVGPMGAVKGKIGSATGGMAGDPQIAAYIKNRNSAITGIRKLFNDSGAPSNFDVERYLDSIPSAFDQPTLANRQWDFLSRQNDMGKETIIQASPLAAYVFERNQGEAPGGGGPKKNAASRFSELSKAGLSKEQAYAQMRSEGY